MKPPIDFANLPEIEENPVILTLIELLEQQSTTIQQQAETIHSYEMKLRVSRAKSQNPKLDPAS